MIPCKRISPSFLEKIPKIIYQKNNKKNIKKIFLWNIKKNEINVKLSKNIVQIHSSWKSRGSLGFWPNYFGFLGLSENLGGYLCSCFIAFLWLNYSNLTPLTPSRVHLWPGIIMKTVFRRNSLFSIWKKKNNFCKNTFK